MSEEQKVYLASKYAANGYDIENLRYGDDLYNEENSNALANEIWEYVEEYFDYGRISFYEKYKEFKLY